MNSISKTPLCICTYRTSTMPLIGRGLSFTDTTLMLAVCWTKANMTLTTSKPTYDMTLTRPCLDACLTMPTTWNHPAVTHDRFIPAHDTSFMNGLGVVCGSLGSHLRSHDPRRDDMRTDYRTSSADTPGSFRVRWYFDFIYTQNRQYSSTAVRFPICNDIS